MSEKSLRERAMTFEPTMDGYEGFIEPQARAYDKRRIHPRYHYMAHVVVHLRHDLKPRVVGFSNSKKKDSFGMPVVAGIFPAERTDGRGLVFLLAWEKGSVQALLTDVQNRTMARVYGRPFGHNGVSFIEIHDLSYELPVQATSELTKYEIQDVTTLVERDITTMAPMVRGMSPWEYGNTRGET